MSAQRMQQLAQRALAHFQRGTTDQAESTLQLPVANYIDPQQYQAERQVIFRQLPQALALSVELPKPGDYKALTVAELPIVMMRGDDGEVRAFLNVCRHRGARLCEDGCDHKRVLACPYHAWVYDRQGALVGRYGAETFGAVDEATLGLTRLPCAERCGLVWVRPSPGDMDLDIAAWLGGFAGELDSLALDTWHIYAQRSIPGPGWKVTMDGYLEAYHHNLVHADTVGKYTVGNLLVLDTYGPHQRLTFGRKSLGELAGQPPAEWQADEHIRLIHSVFPNLSVSGILGDHCLVSQIFPGPTAATTVTVQTVLAAKAPVSEAEHAATRAFSDMVLFAVEEEDYRIGFGIQAGLHSGANDTFIIGRNEPAVQNYHRWVEHFVSQARAGAEPAGWRA